MADGARTVRVVDPVHGYVNLTPIERILLDSRPAQRLHYVAQSGLAHLVFPDLRTSRFVHSLGAMHLASRFLLASLEHAESTARQAAEEGIEEQFPRRSEASASPDIAAEGLQHDGLIADRAVLDDCKPCVLLAEQGLRLAALFHDLGHLPFSHDFEYALTQLAADPRSTSATPRHSLSSAPARMLSMSLGSSLFAGGHLAHAASGSGS